MPTTRTFRYFRDPLCLGATLIYILNRTIFKPAFGTHVPLLRNHLDDFLLIPAALPFLLWIFRKLNLRSNDIRPTAQEITTWTIVWSFLFEGIFPVLVPKATADWRDVLAYAIGAVVAWIFWSRESR
ncbi:MAG: hypothetical protein WCO60_11080 [Verrucomicrobiota bacterium]